jgi:hypothetical protein
MTRFLSYDQSPLFTVSAATQPVNATERWYEQSNALFFKCRKCSLQHFKSKGRATLRRPADTSLDVWCLADYCTYSALMQSPAGSPAGPDPLHAARDPSGVWWVGRC